MKACTVSQAATQTNLSRRFVLSCQSGVMPLSPADFVRLRIPVSSSLSTYHHGPSSGASRMCIIVCFLDSLPRLVALNKALWACLTSIFLARCDSVYFAPALDHSRHRVSWCCHWLARSAPNLVSQCATMGGVRHGRVTDPEIARRLSRRCHWSELDTQQTTTTTSGTSWVEGYFGMGKI